MILHYFKKKENKDKLIALSTYRDLIKLINTLLKNNYNQITSNFENTFELSCLFLFCFFNSYKNDKKITDEVMKLFIEDIDRCLILEGIGDMKIGKYVKFYLKKFYFRISSYEKIFIDNRYQNFEKFMCDFKILKPNDSNVGFYKLLFQHSLDLLERAKNHDIYEDKYFKN